MISICSEVLVRFYTPEGYMDIKGGKLTDKDKHIFGIPGKLAYLDIITGVILIVIGALVIHDIIAVNGASYFIGFGSTQFTIGLIFKLLSSYCCPCFCGANRFADNGVGRFNLLTFEQIIQQDQ